MKETQRLVHDCVDVHDGPVTGYMIYCVACGCGHKFDVGRWTFNGNYEKPTFSPSMLVKQPGWVNITHDRWLTLWSSENIDETDHGFRVPYILVGNNCPADLAEIARRLGVSDQLGRLATYEAVQQRVQQELSKLPEHICHSFVRDGLIQYLPDCTHHLAGQTVPLEPF